MARVHRLGQTRTVHVYRLVSAGTIEERNVERAQKKLYLDQVVNRDSARSTDNKASAAFSTDEMLHALSFGSQAVFGDSNSELNCLPTEEDINHIIDRSRSEDDSMGNLKGGATEKVGEFDASAELTATSKLGGIDFQAIREAHWKNGGRKQSEAALIGGAQEVAKRQVKSRITIVKDDEGRDIPVLKSNNYDLESGESSVFDRELAGRIQGDVVEKKRAGQLRSGVDFGSSKICQVCGEGETSTPLTLCPICPVATHQVCFADFCNQTGCISLLWGKSCSHHRCIKCNKSPSIAGGILFPCQSCPKSFCEDCLESEAIAGDIGTCDRWKELGYSTKHASYIHCSEECEKFSREKFGWMSEGAPKFTLPPAIDVSYAFGKRVTEDVPEPTRPLETEKVFEVGAIVEVQARDNKQPGGRGIVKSAEFVEYVGWLYSVKYSMGGVGSGIESFYITGVDEDDDVRKPRNVRKVTYHDMSNWTPTPKKPQGPKPKANKKNEVNDILIPLPTTMPVSIFASTGQYDVLVPMNASEPLPLVLRHKRAPVVFNGWKKSSDASDGRDDGVGAAKLHAGRPKIARGDILMAVGGRCVSGMPRRDVKRMMRSAVEVGCVKLRFQDIRFVRQVISKLSIEEAKMLTRAMNAYRSSPFGSIEPALLADTAQATGLPKDAILDRARQIAEARARAAADRAAAAEKARLEEEKMKSAGEKQSADVRRDVRPTFAPPKLVSFNDTCRTGASKSPRLSEVSDVTVATSITPTESVEKATDMIKKHSTGLVIDASESANNASAVFGKPKCSTPVTIDLTIASGEMPGKGHNGGGAAQQEVVDLT